MKSRASHGSNRYGGYGVLAHAPLENPRRSCYTGATLGQGRRTAIKLLLHTCCAPCSVMSVRALRDEGIEPAAYWYNPNIHPFAEYRARRDALREYLKAISLELMEEDAYGLRPFVRAVAGDIDGRCVWCYDVRMDVAARYAAGHGFTHFSTTLFYSPYQKHELLKETAERAAQKHGVALLYRDFRPYFREGQRQARALGLYMQKYCGCVFSEEERYAGKRLKLGMKNEE
jgi:epoxyqueuosine reductase